MQALGSSVAHDIATSRSALQHEPCQVPVSVEVSKVQRITGVAVFGAYNGCSLLVLADRRMARVRGECGSGESFGCGNLLPRCAHWQSSTKIRSETMYRFYAERPVLSRIIGRLWTIGTSMYKAESVIPFI
nr:hypothetical protein CFP56_21204 [Quercus suber]